MCQTKSSEPSWECRKLLNLKLIFAQNNVNYSK